MNQQQLRKRANLATVTEAADILDVPVERLKAAIHRGNLRIVKRLRTWPYTRWIDLEQVEDYLTATPQIRYAPHDDPMDHVRARGIDLRSAQAGVRRAQRRAARR